MDVQANLFNNFWPFEKRLVDKFLHVNLKYLFSLIIAELEEDLVIIFKVHTWSDFVILNLCLDSLVDAWVPHDHVSDVTETLVITFSHE